MHHSKHLILPYLVMESQIILKTGLSKGLVETKHIDLVDIGISPKEYGNANNIKYSTCKRCINIGLIVEKEYLQEYLSHWTIVWRRKAKTTNCSCRSKKEYLQKYLSYWINSWEGILAKSIFRLANSWRKINT